MLNCNGQMDCFAKSVYCLDFSVASFLFLFFPDVTHDCQTIR